MAHLLSMILLTPFAGAAVVLVAGRDRVRVSYAVATAAALVSVFLGVPLWRGYDPAATTWQLTERIDLIGSIGFGYALGVDGASIVLVILTAVVGLVAIASAWTEADDPERDYPMAILLLMGALFGAFLAVDLLLFFLFWIGALGAAGFLVWRVGDRDRGRHAMTSFAVHAAAGSTALLAGLLILCFSAFRDTGAFTFDIARLLDLTIGPDVQKMAFVPMFVAFSVVLALFPFHAWLPAAVERQPPAGVLMLTAALLKLGTYGLIRFTLPLLPVASRDFSRPVSALAIISVVFLAVAAFRQSNWKRVVAYSSAAAMAFAVASMFQLAPLAVTVGVLQQIDHGIIVAAIVAASAIYDRHAIGADAGERHPLNARLVFAILIGATSILTIWDVARAKSSTPGAFLAKIETSVGRVVARVNPAYAPMVKQPSDCGKPAPGAPGSSAPAGWVTALPCEGAPGK